MRRLHTTPLSELLPTPPRWAVWPILAFALLELTAIAWLICSVWAQRH